MPHPLAQERGRIESTAVVPMGVCVSVCVREREESECISLAVGGGWRGEGVVC